VRDEDGGHSETCAATDARRRAPATKPRQAETSQVLAERSVNNRLAVSVRFERREDWCRRQSPPRRTLMSEQRPPSRPKEPAQLRRVTVRVPEAYVEDLLRSW
jgi:hypothetical protein